MSKRSAFATRSFDCRLSRDDSGLRRGQATLDVRDGGPELRKSVDGPSPSTEDGAREAESSPDWYSAPASVTDVTCDGTSWARPSSSDADDREGVGSTGARGAPPRASMASRTATRMEAASAHRALRSKARARSTMTATSGGSSGTRDKIGGAGHVAFLMS